MAQDFRVGVAGLIHGHVWGLIDAWKKVPGAKLVSVADATPLLEQADGFERKYPDWREMLEKESLDALVVTSDSRESAEIAVAALEKGIPTMVEKAMAVSAADADGMLAAAKASGKPLMINWPFAWSAWMPELKRLLDAGEIGQVFHLRYRNGHHGPKEIGCDEYFVGWLHDEARNGGGAIADFGSYGAVLAASYFGLPETVYCIRHNATKDYAISDDHAVLLLKYPKLTVFLEGTWATNGFDGGPNPVVHGSTGTLGVYGDQIEKASGWDKPVRSDLPSPNETNPAAYFMARIQDGKPLEGVLSPETSANACRILDAAIKSSSSGCAERL